MKTLAVLLLVFGIVRTQVTFTGDAEVDFLNLPPGPASTFFNKPNFNPISQSPTMALNGWISGWDVKNLYSQYDYTADILYVGINCWTICGDADGDGDPGAASCPDTTDFPDLANSEQVSFMIMPEPPVDYNPDGTTWIGFRPTVVFGVSIFDSIVNFDAYRLALTCTQSPTVCTNQIIPVRVQNPGQWYSGRFNAQPGKTMIQRPQYFASPSLAKPDLEFKVFNFSYYPNTRLEPGVNPLRFAAAYVLGSTADAVGEEREPPFIYQIPCAIQDRCGRCGGNEEDVDACGVCFGGNVSCADCEGVPNGGKVYDACGVCGGDNSTCADCAGIPNGDTEYDFCGVCGGDSTTCDCFFDSHLIFEGADSFIALNDRFANHGKDGRIYVNWGRARGLLSFKNVRQSILQDSSGDPEILSAVVKMHIAGVACEWSDPDLALHRIKDFEETEATWDCAANDVYGACLHWRQLRLLPQIDVDYETEPAQVVQVFPGQQGELHFDVLDDLLNYMYDPFHLHLNYMVKKNCELSPGCSAFFTCESGQCSTLEVLMRTACPRTPRPPPPTPRPKVVWNWDVEVDC